MQTTVQPSRPQESREPPSSDRWPKARRAFARELSALGLPQSPVSAPPVTKEELASLPEVVRRYFAFMRVVGRPRDWSFRAGFKGCFRRGPDHPWLACESWQYDSALGPARFFYMKLVLGGVLPTVVRDTYIRGHGRMLAKVFDLIPVADGTGVALDVGELVTYLNDAILFAPTMLLDADTIWTAIDDTSFDVTLRDGGRSVSARVFLDDRGAPYDFSTTDRFVSDPYTKGQPLVQARWTTPIDGWVLRNDRVIPSRGRAVWHLPGGTFDYADFPFEHEAHHLAYNVLPGE